MQDARALNNSRNLRSWRAWEAEAFRRSGFFATAVVFPLLVAGFVMACALFKPAPRDLLTGFCLYLATTGGLMVFVVLRLNAWKQVNPWTPPS